MLMKMFKNQLIVGLKEDYL